MKAITRSLLTLLSVPGLLFSVLGLLLTPEIASSEGKRRSQPGIEVAPRAQLRGGTEPRSADLIEVTERYGLPMLRRSPRFSSINSGRYYASLPSGERVEFTLSPTTQEFTDKLIRRAPAPHVAAVVMDPRSGRVLAMAGKSHQLRDPLLHADFPAASLFKVVTAAAALERGDVDPYEMVRFRGGTYTLNRSNYYPNPRADRRTMSLAEALGRSCNPVFGRVALERLSAPLLRKYTERFGFNDDIGFDIPLPVSSASIPDERYELSRTAAGFGAVKTSPIHSAALMSGVANNGVLLRPFVVDRIVTPEGTTSYVAKPRVVARMVQPQTAQKLLNMLEYTTTVGTSRRDFVGKRGRSLLGARVAAKTGTLTGHNPRGLHHWFIAAAPIENPRVAVAVLSIEPRASSARAGYLGRLLLQETLKER